MTTRHEMKLPITYNNCIVVFYSFKMEFSTYHNQQGYNARDIGDQ